MSHQPPIDLGLGFDSRLLVKLDSGLTLHIPCRLRDQSGTNANLIVIDLHRPAHYFSGLDPYHAVENANYNINAGFSGARKRRHPWRAGHERQLSDHGILSLMRISSDAGWRPRSGHRVLRKTRSRGPGCGCVRGQRKVPRRGAY